MLDHEHKLTPLGSRCAKWPVEPRVAVMLERASEFNAVPLACGVAALLEERNSNERSLHDALALRLRQPKRFPSWHREALRLAKRAGVALNDAVLVPLGPLLALAYPD